MQKVKSWFRNLFQPVDRYQGVRNEIGLMMEASKIILEADGQNVDLKRLYELLSQMTLLDFVWVDQLMTPMEMACSVANPWCLAALIAHGADVNGKERTNISTTNTGSTGQQRPGGRYRPLHEVCKNTENTESPWVVDCACMLLQKGADVHALDSEGYQAIHYAAMSGNPQLVQCLLEAGAAVEGSDPVQKLTPLAWATTVPPFEVLERSTSDSDLQNNRKLIQDTDQNATPDTARDTSRDTVGDTTTDTSHDATQDTTPDTARDTSRDTVGDTTTDTRQDATQDTTPDTARDTSRDTKGDTTTDTSQDDTAIEETPDAPQTPNNHPKTSSQEECISHTSQQEQAQNNTPQAEGSQSASIGAEASTTTTKNRSSIPAVKKSRLGVMRVLLTHGAHVNRVIGPNDSISVAASLLYVPRVQVLLAYGADVNNPRDPHHLCLFKRILQSTSEKGVRHDNFLTMIFLLVAAGARITLESLENEIRPVLDDRAELASVRDVVYSVLFDAANAPLPLKMLCRVKVRSMLPPDIDASIKRCPLPEVMQGYLRFEDVVVGGLVDK